MRPVLVCAAVLGVLVAVAGCGGHSSPPAAKRPGGPPARPRDAEPIGRLSRAEYTSIVREYTLLAPLRSSDAAPDVVRRAAAACGTTAEPNTRLMQLVRRDCLNALQFFAALGELELDPSVAGRYTRLAATIRGVVDNAEEINAELRRREIGGLCAHSVGIPRADVLSMNEAAKAAADAGVAERAGKSSEFLVAQHRLTDALAKGSSDDPLVGIKRGCPHRQSSTPKRRRPKPRPTPKPRLPQPGEGISA